MSEIIPFSNGTQYMDWTECNCARCKKSVIVTDPNGDALPTCQIEYALMAASISDGWIPTVIAIRAGYDSSRYVWPCAEVDWTEEWKAEYRAMHPQPAEAETGE